MKIWNNINHRVMIISSISLMLLLLAITFQHTYDLQPCTLCLWQRWPHIFTIIAGIVFVSYKGDNPKINLLFLFFGTISVLIGTFISMFHVGVEIGLWNGLSTCGMIDFTLPTEDIILLMEKPSPDCSDPQWKFMGHSMTAWNLFFSATLSGAWFGTFLTCLLYTSPSPRDRG